MKKCLAVVLVALMSMAVSAYEYVENADLDIAAGETVQIPEGISGTPRIGKVTMAAGSKLYLPKDQENIWIDSINGDGEIITEFAGGTWNAQQLYILNPSVFAGKFIGFVRFYAYGPLTLTNTESPFADYRVSNATAGTSAILQVKKLGLVCEPSSIGPSDNLQLYDGGSLKYIGEGETTDHGLAIVQPGNPADCYVDAGENGGIIWAAGSGPRGLTGDWYSEGGTYFTRLTVTGNNKKPCEMQGSIRFESSSSGMSAYMAKEGTGTWKFTHSEKRTKMRGPFAVREGTLQFETLADTGMVCSLGMSDLLYDAPAGVTAPDSKYAVDYAFLLGGGLNPIFEFVGAGNNGSNRPIALTGTKSTISTIGTGAIALNGGVKAFDAGEKTLCLKSAADSGKAIIKDIADGAGKVSVVKEGAGNWTLDGDLMFSGTFEVKGGKAIVAGPQPARNYTWYRLTLQESKNANDVEFQAQVHLQALGLFDGDGKMICRNLEELHPDGYDEVPFNDGGWVLNEAFHPEKLQPGQCSVGKVDQGDVWRPGFEYYPCNPPANIFKAQGGYLGMMRTQIVPTLGNGVTVSIVFRPREDEVIEYYDVMNLWSHNECADHITKWKLEGSVDGYNWNELHKIEQCVEGTEGYWSSKPVLGQINGVIAELNCKDNDFGYKIASGIPGEAAKAQLENASVKVAKGATLAAEGEVVLKAITVDATNGNGTFDGVKFAEKGVVNIVNAYKQQTSELTLVNIDAASIANLKRWQVTVEGEVLADAKFTINEAARTITTNVGVHPLCILFGQTIVKAADYGLSPAAMASVNTKAMNEALAGGNKVVRITQPGEYLVDDTIFIDDNTVIDCVEGVIFKRAKEYCHMFANRKAYDWDANAYNENITIRNLEIESSCGGKIDDYDSPAKGMRGQLAFFKVKNVKICNFKCVDFKACYCIQFVDFDNVLVEDFIIRGDKDGIHFNRGKNFVVRNGRLRTGDDGIAINAGDWPLLCTPTMGSIENGLVENVVDELGGSCNFARIITGSWIEWYDGMPLQRGDMLKVGTNVYTVAFSALSTNETVSHTAPTHTRGIWTSPEGIPFLFLQGDGETHADIRNVTIKNCTLEAERSISCSWEMCEYARLVHPSVPDDDLPVIDIKVENVHKTTPGHDYFIRGNGNARIDIVNCSVASGPLVYMYSNSRKEHAYDWWVRVDGGEWITRDPSKDSLWVTMPSK